MFTDTPSAKLLSVGEVARLLRLHLHSVRADELEDWLVANAVQRGDETE